VTQSAVAGPRTLASDIVFGESARWHEGRLWFADWGAGEVIAVDLAGNREIIARVPLRLNPRGMSSAFIVGPSTAVPG
jgi:sugar lactone lactonase YvrE